MKAIYAVEGLLLLLLGVIALFLHAHPRLLGGHSHTVALPFFILGVQEPHPNWRFLLPLLFWVLVFGFVAVSGKAPFFFR
jgi:hypothetical protein